jgi:hypothetical protein
MCPVDREALTLIVPGLSSLVFLSCPTTLCYFYPVWLFGHLPYRITNNRTIATSLSHPVCCYLLFLSVFPYFRSTIIWGIVTRRSSLGQHSRNLAMRPDVAAVQAPSPPPSAHSIRSSITLYEQAEIISIERNKAKEEPMEIQVEDPPPVVERQKPRRTKGHYRLTDFIIQRTLGTGSFGRVHLGVISIFPPPSPSYDFS